MPQNHFSTCGALGRAALQGEVAGPLVFCSLGKVAPVTKNDPSEKSLLWD